MKLVSLLFTPVYYLPEKPISHQLSQRECFYLLVALGPVSRFMTRNLYALLDSRYAWCDVLKVRPKAHMELEFWVNCLHSYNSHSQPIIALQLLEWRTQMQVIQSMAGTLWSMVFMWLKVVGYPRQGWQKVYMIGGASKSEDN